VIKTRNGEGEETDEALEAAPGASYRGADWKGESEGNERIKPA
jgi:hypothetical protein